MPFCKGLTIAAAPILMIIYCDWGRILQGGGAIEFEYASFQDEDVQDQLLFVVENSSWYTGTQPSQKQGSVWLTPDPRDPIPTNTTTNNIGRIIYKDPIQFVSNISSCSSNIRIASFNTSFTFQIITTAPYKMCGSGMAFFISDSSTAPNNSTGAYLGLVDNTAPDASRFFAVEFDTRISPPFHEFSASHIGIDINSLESVNITDTRPSSGSSFYPELFLYNNYTFTAWIEYDATAGVIQVWMTNMTSPQRRPTMPCLQMDFDLSHHVFKEYMYVGFTAANDAVNNSMEGHVLYSWSFSSDELTYPQCKKALPLPIILPIVIFCALVLCCVVCMCISKRRSCMKPQITNKAHIDMTSAVQYTYTELDIATSSFAEYNKIGKGASSTVYKGTLADGSTVAVKRLKECVRREEDFMSEAKIISSIRHRNLLQLQGWCYEKGEAMLVYKYMSNGSLDAYLFGNKRGTLHSETRLKILMGVACALEYLHRGLRECVLHRDVKAANVLLSDELEPILGDFGLARLIEHDKVVTMTIAGTLGYVAPEVLSRGKATEKADVYSFGVFALEVACGRSATEYSLTTNIEEGNLLDWVWRLHKSDELMRAIDLSMIREDLPASEMESWRCVLHVALMCCNAIPEARPTMRQVSQVLQGDTLLLPKYWEGMSFKLNSARSSTCGSSNSASSRLTSPFRGQTQSWDSSHKAFK